jgi:hypothetical protein
MPAAEQPIVRHSHEKPDPAVGAGEAHRERNAVTFVLPNPGQRAFYGVEQQ